MLKLYPHPNYLKVQNTYLWLFYFILILPLFISGISILLKLSILLLLFFVNLLIINRLVKKFSGKYYELSFDSDSIIYKGKTFKIDELKYESKFFEKAYGLGRVIGNGLCFYGIHIDDWKRHFEN